MCVCGFFPMRNRFYRNTRVTCNRVCGSVSPLRRTRTTYYTARPKSITMTPPSIQPSDSTRGETSRGQRRVAITIDRRVVRYKRVKKRTAVKNEKKKNEIKTPTTSNNYETRPERGKHRGNADGQRAKIEASRFATDETRRMLMPRRTDRFRPVVVKSDTTHTSRANPSFRRHNRTPRYDNTLNMRHALKVVRPSARREYGLVYTTACRSHSALAGIFRPTRSVVKS